jgi:hypothetical protein
MALLLNTDVFRIGQAIGAHRPRELQCANTVCTSVTSNSARHLFCSAGSIPGETFAHGSVVAGACGLSLMTCNALVADPCSACADGPLTVHRGETIGMRRLKK